jgi:ubiquinone/menaquinone biosynthesis C-methylase UbiE
MVKLYDKITYWYDANRSKGLMEKEYLGLALKYLPKGGTVLDLGCGTGEPLAKFFSENGFEVTGVDVSGQMINLCIKRFPEMRWILGDMRSLDLGEEFDLVLAWDSFFHLNQDDQRKMFTVFESHLKEGGILIFTSGWQQGEVYSQMCGYNFYHASLDLEEYQSLLNHHHFRVLLNKVEDPDCGEHTVWVVQKKVL